MRGRGEGGESDWRAADECHLPHLLGYGVHTHIATDRVVQRGQTHEQCSKEVAVGSGPHWIVLPATCRERDMHSRQQPVSASDSVEQCSSLQPSQLGAMNMNLFCSST